MGVVAHHWLLFVPYDGSVRVVALMAGLVRDLGGTCVHLFFLLSGCGLTISRLRQEDFRLGRWVRRRFEKIVVPYWAVIIATFCLANFVLYASGGRGDGYSWLSLVSYLTFTRNHYEPAWAMNPTLWFMPVIVGLYVLFPVLVSILKKRGMGVFLVLAALMSYGSIALFRLSDYRIDHQSAVSLFFVLEFAMGIVLGFLAVLNPERLVSLVGTKSLMLGVGLYALSYLATKSFESGSLYNDPMTAASVLLVTINVWNRFLRNAGEKMRSVLDEVSKVSYIMYLIHGAVILYIAIPLLRETGALPLNPGVSMALAGIFVVVVFGLGRLLYGPIMGVAKIGTQSK